MYIYSKLRKRHIVCQDGAQIGTWQSLRELMDSLPSDKFAYSHKSYIVNLDMVDTVNESKIQNTFAIGQNRVKHTHTTFVSALCFRYLNCEAAFS